MLIFVEFRVSCYNCSQHNIGEACAQMLSLLPVKFEKRKIHFYIRNSQAKFDLDTFTSTLMVCRPNIVFFGFYINGTSLKYTKCSTLTQEFITQRSLNVYLISFVLAPRCGSLRIIPGPSELLAIRFYNGNRVEHLDGAEPIVLPEGVYFDSLAD